MDFYQQCWWHKLGTKTEEDVYVLGKDLPRIAEIELKTSEDGQYVLATTQNGDGGEYRLDLILAGPTGGPRPTLKLADFADQVIMGEFGPDGSLYLLSRADAPRGKILRVALPALDRARGAEPALSAATVIVPQGEPTIEDVTITKSRLYVTDQLGGPSQFRVFDLAGKTLEPVKLKPISSVRGVVALAGDDILLQHADLPRSTRVVPLCSGNRRKHEDRAVPHVARGLQRLRGRPRDCDFEGRHEGPG